MKKTTTLILFLSMFSCISVRGTTVIIQAIGTSAANELFSPQVANANCGDTIRWVLVSGTHTTASTNIPAGAQPWASGNITASGFIYVVTVPGTYEYTCHPQTGGHMEASIIVTCTSGIESQSSVNFPTVYPNPSSGKISVFNKDAQSCTFKLYSAQGKKMFDHQIGNQVTEEDLNIPNGIYFYELNSEEKVIGKGKLVIQN